ncbi:unnamed protein product [Miscanthus lutarioriparius]|uniref:PGRL1A transmembrane protein n=1 Tax=Miscanthus lutarioriparius TaxID=422564 RepID=A0A811NS29_9POAL|nr:unnamed protein product [Miscanthus lutarioriparius]
MASDARLSLPCRLPSLLPPPVLLLRRCSCSTGCRAHQPPRGAASGRRRCPRAPAAGAGLAPPRAFYYDQKAIMSNEEFDNLKEELMWEGSSVVMLSADEQKLLEASMAYVSGNPIMTDEEFDQLKLRLKKEGSDIVQEGPRCSLRSRKVYSDLTVDYFKMLLLNVPAAVVALTLFFFLDDLTGFEITLLLELPEPFSFIFTWFAALPLIFWVAQAITNVIVKDFLILKGPCPNCGTENLSFFGTILSVSSGGSKNSVKCTSCGTTLEYDSASRLITLLEPAEA